MFISSNIFFSIWFYLMIITVIQATLLKTVKMNTNKKYEFQERQLKF